MSSGKPISTAGQSASEVGLVKLGWISGLFGVRGWVKVFSDTSPRTNILNFPCWHLCLAGEWKEHRLSTGRAQGKGVVALLEGFEDRDQAAALVDAEIAVPRNLLPAIGTDEFYWTDLEGTQVVTLEGVDLGRLESLFSTGSNDVMVVMGERERLIPFIDGTVIDVDLDLQRVTVDWDPEF
ncbi:MAG: ribosome maturation factor RimM [Gammaproteobacteria bacterium]|nr:ribosome maturation factor RimM [Gammaproteobacteria bacterium]MCP5407733.1 ribosome maturation factor RimM [Chromatiaceae bacterium]MCP5441653.1 ribosome maturation factor RimM [Chromatiaceae bacterium]